MRQSGGVVAVDGLLDLSGDYTIAGGELRGNGVIRSHVFNAGAIHPGSSAGVLRIEDDYTQTATGNLQLELEGTEPADYDRLVVTGNVNLAGNLELDLVTPFVPGAGTSFTVMTFNSLLGSFDTVTGAHPDPSIQFAVEPDASALRVVAQRNYKRWDGGGDGSSWEDALNWSNDTLPDANDYVLIEVADTDPVIVHSTGSTQLQSLVSYEPLMLSGGTLELAAESVFHAPLSIVNSGRLDGGGDVTLQTAFTWSGGTVAGTGRITSLGNWLIEGNAPKFALGHRQFINEGSLLWTGGEVFRGLDEPTFLNRASASFTIQTDSDFFSGPLPNGFITNAGTVHKSVGTGTSSFKSPFTNLGTVQVESGTLRFMDFLQAGGSTELEDARLESQAAVRIEGGLLGGTGTIAGDVVNFGTVNPGLGGAAGSLLILGDLTQDETGELVFDLGGGPLDPYDQVEVRGVAELNGRLAINAQVPSQIEVGDLFSLLSYEIAVGEFSDRAGLELPGGKFDVRTGVEQLTLELTESFDVSWLASQLRVGLDGIEGSLPDWFSAFNLPAFSDLGLPRPRVPALTDNLADLFDLDTVAASITLPDIVAAASVAELRSQLLSHGVTIDCLAGQGGGPACQAGDLVQIRVDRTVPGLSVGVEWDDADLDRLAGLSSSLDLNGLLSTTADVGLQLIVGVDETGFYLDSTSVLTIDLSSSGHLSAAAVDISGTPTSLAGSVAAHTLVSLQPLPALPRHRMDALQDNPFNVLAPHASGAATVMLQATTGPVDLQWVTNLEAGADLGATHQLAGTLEIAAWEDRSAEHPGPAQFAFSGSFDGTHWELSSAESGPFHLGVIRIDQPSIELLFGESSWSGTASAHAIVSPDSAGISRTMSVAVSGTLDQNALNATGVMQVPQLSLGQTSNSAVLVALSGIDVTGALEVDFVNNTAKGSVTLVAAEGSVTPQQSLSGRIENVTGVLDSTGGLIASAGSIALEFGGVVELRQAAVSMTIDPQAQANEVMLQITDAKLALPQLERGGQAPTFTVSEFGIRHDGSAYVGHPADNLVMVEFALPQGYPELLAVGGLLPFRIDTLTATFDNNDLNSLGVEIRGQVALDDSLFGWSDSLVTVSGVDASAPFTIELAPGRLGAGALRAANIGPITIDFTGLQVAGVEASGQIVVGAIDTSGVPDSISGHVRVTTGNAVFPVDVTVDVTGTIQDDTEQVELRLRGNGSLDPGDIHASARAVLDATVLTGYGVGGVASDEFGIQADWNLVEGEISSSLDFTLDDVFHLTGDVTVNTNGTVEFADAQLEFLGQFTPWGTHAVSGVTIDSNGNIFASSTTIALGNGAEVAAGTTTLASLDGVSVTLTGLQVTAGTTLSAGALTVAAETGGAAAGQQRLHRDRDGPVGSDLPERRGGNDPLPAGTLELMANSVAADFGATNVSVSLDDVGLTFRSDATLATPFLSVGAGTVVVPLLDSRQVEFGATGLKLNGDGVFSFDSAEVVVADGVARSLGLAGLLPFNVKRVILESLDNAAPRFDRFKITTVGEFRFEVFEELLESIPGTPILNIGGDQSNYEGDLPGAGERSRFFVANGTVLDNDPGTGNPNEFSIAFAVDASGAQQLPIQVEDFGPIFIGFQDLEFGPMTANAWVRLGGYQDGLFVNEFDASVDLALDVATAQLKGGLRVGGSLEVSSGEAVLDLDIGLTASFSAADAIVEFDELSVEFGSVLALDTGSFLVTQASLELEGLGVNSIAIHAGEFVTLTGTNAQIGLAPGEPFSRFGGDAATGDGALEIAFGDDRGSGDNPLQGLGGAVMNFGVGFDPNATGGLPFQFYQLPGFGVRIDIPSDFKFGLPDWVPLTVRSVGFKFHEPPADVAAGIWEGSAEIGDLTSISLIFSGGLVGTELFPITAQAERLEVDIERLNDCVAAFLAEIGKSGAESAEPGFSWEQLGAYAVTHCTGDDFPVTNIDAVEFGFEEFDLGPVTIGGVLGFGMLDIDGDAMSDVLYGRILGQFAYSDMGLGVELIVTQYGPVLARLFAGVPIPIGTLVGALVGSVVPGIGTGAGASVGKNTGFILTGFEGGFVFGGDRLPTVTDPLDILDSDFPFHEPLDVTLDNVKTLVHASVTANPPAPTWSEGFTLAGSATLTNEYVGGMVGGVLTLGANVGYADQVGVQLFGIGDLEVIGMDLASVGVLFDFKEPGNPTLNLAFGMPGTPGNPLSLVLPARAELGGRIETTGVAEGVMLAANGFMQALERGILDAQDTGVGLGQEFLAHVLDEIAAPLDAARVWSLRK